jgi:peptide/nickel transport system substrate-binding protein
MLAVLVLSACAPAATATTAPTAAETSAPGATATTGAPAAETPTTTAAFTSKDPTTFNEVTIGGPDTLDPALAYDTASGGIIFNVYETLDFYNKGNATDFVPQLASKWDISSDGKTYTFTIRQGVKFHDGSDLTPNDVAYSLTRGILQGGGSSPQWLMDEPIFGIGTYDITQLVEIAQKSGLDALKFPVTADQLKDTGALTDNREELAKVPADVLKGVCEKVQSSIVPDAQNNTVTITLAQPWGPFLAVLAQSWGSILNQKWASTNGAWDGSCDTWQKFYGMTSDEDPLSKIMNGTGPFKFDNWDQANSQVTLARNDAYWRTEPAWTGGPTGPAKLQKVVITGINEWGTRFSMLQAGDADFIVVPRANVVQVDPLVGETCQWNADKGDFDACQATSSQPIRLFKGHPAVTQDTMFLNEAIGTTGGNPYMGSGKLDGNGIPADFFADPHVRLAFNYCFDWDTYIKQTWLGEAVQSVTLPVPGMPGYDANAPHYSFDLDKCKTELQASTLKAADGKSLFDTGFRVEVAYNLGNDPRRTAVELLASNFAKVGSKFQVVPAGLQWPQLLHAYQAGSLPGFVIGWQEDIHDPHNWYQPYLIGTYGSTQGFPKDTITKFQDLITQGVETTAPADRAKIYAQLNQAIYDFAPDVLLVVPQGRHYEQRWVNGWYYNPIYPDIYFYPLSKS